MRYVKGHGLQTRSRIVENASYGLRQSGAEGMSVVDLMKLADPFDLNGDGSQTFTFPYVTIEDALILDPRTLLVVNDNNFPYGGGRELASDNTEYLRIRVPVSLIPDERDDDKYDKDDD